MSCHELHLMATMLARKIVHANGQYAARTSAPESLALPNGDVETHATGW